MAKAEALASPWVGRGDDAVALYDEVVRRLDDSPIAGAEGLAGDALLAKVECLRDSKRFDDAISLCDSLELRLAGGRAATAPATAAERRQLARARLLKARSLIALRRSAEALALCDAAVARALPASEPDLGLTVLELLFEKGSVLYDAQRFAEALSAFDELLRRLPPATGADAHDASRAWAARGLNAKGATLAALDRRAEAVAAFDAVLEQAPDNELLLADTLLAKGDNLVALGRREDAIETFNRTIAYCQKQASYRMGDDYVGWALRRVAGDAVKRRKELEEP